ncbi:response regulator [Fulvimarina endophytica]|uniref:Response regulator n=1 Tax=Fulvimarina endophytica TaxID=2293836 RepID=A0A371WYS5_9HYPH|nr:response regulator [Fulvimarina endophytica]RFC62140.1 response regulator [Fulvimarina endophytica]
MMRILILEDEPLIALDMEDTVRESCGADVCLAHTVAEAKSFLDEGDIDFALLDVRLEGHGNTSLPIAYHLSSKDVPFCFVSSAVDQLPARYDKVPHVKKPFELSQLQAVLP